MQKALLLLVCGIVVLAGCQSDSHDPQKESHRDVIRISISDDPASVDPRTANNLNAITAIRMLFEGLMRPALDGTLEPGVAESVEISPDLKRYTFRLRKSFWNNGDPVTSEDFAYTWKTILTPSFLAPNAYQFFCIKGAKDAKEGNKSLDEVGIYTPDLHTLVIELEQPTPYFLELTAFHPFFPVHKKWAEETSSYVIGNGPFNVDQWLHHNVFSVKKSLTYWDVNAVKLEGIQAYALDENTALQLYENGELDRIGSPLSLIPADSMAALKKNGTLHTSSAAGTQWLRFNTSRKPLNHPKIRKALSYAIDRESLVTNITQGNQLPATGIVPPQFGLQEKPYFNDHDIHIAQKMFLEGLKEIDITSDELAPIVLSYSANDRTHKLVQALQQQWQDVLPVQIKLQAIESKAFFSNVAMGDYQIAIGSWFADFRDPMNFLEVFKQRSNRTNSTGWENAEYITFLDSASRESNPEKRRFLLHKAEEILIDEMPVAPIYYYTLIYLKRDGVQGVLLSDLGYLDFKHASIDRDQ